MNAARALSAAIARLRAAGVQDPARDARRLLAHAARIEASQVTLIAQEDLAPEVAEAFARMIETRAGRVPVSHIVGYRAFYGRRFGVSGKVLDPRPETELLIEAALSEPFEDVLDLGTGSGAILVTLLAEEPGARGTGTDMSEDACLQASQNAHQHGVAGRARIFRADWLSGVAGAFDLIVSNPPYIAADEMDDLAPEVRRHEPRGALTDEGDGLGAYRVIARDAPRHLRPGGRLIVEIGPSQAAAVSAMFQSARLTEITVLSDLDGRDRVVLGRAP